MGSAPPGYFMDNVISEYQKWKQHGEALRVQAKQAMETRFRDLLLEAARIGQEYHSDFGVTLKPPPAITAFRYKAGAKTKKPAKGLAVKAETVKTATVRATTDPKISALEKKLAQARTKLDAAKTAGKPTKNLEDRIYEIEDELRLAGER